MMKISVAIYLMFLCGIIGLGIGVKLEQRSYQQVPITITQPSELLGFMIPVKDDREDVIIAAQAELVRNGISCVIDGEFGGQTALGICELLVRIENGYVVKSIYTE